MKETLKTTVTTLLISTVFGLLLYATLAIAQPTGPNNINVSSSSRGDITNTPQQVNAQAGNVTEITIDATSITQAWQGYYGNITGSITLEDSSGAVFYNWSNLGSISGEVFASRNDSITWGSVNCTNSANMSTEDSYLGKVNTDPDSVNQTFSSKNHPTFQVGSTSFSTDQCWSTNAFGPSGAQTTDFYQVLLSDGSGDTVYTTLIDADTNGFNNVAYDFQLLVGENGNATSTGVTAYYFYIELN